MTRPNDEASEPDDDASAGPLRRCIASGESVAVEGLLRFVVGPDDVLVPDLARRLPGRGIWVTADRASLERAVTRKLFPRAARRPVAVPPDLAARVEALLLRRCCELLSLARRAGEAVAGLEKVRSVTERGFDGRSRRMPALLLLARDAGAEGRRRMAELAGDTPVVRCLDAAELAAVFGREHAVHGAVAEGGLGRSLEIEAARLAGFRDAGDNAGQRG
ncbi:MAG: RNA-binding protein [Alphaproteobacteria bacterium]